MDLNKYRNCINNLINWEWKTLKQLRRKRRKNIFLRGAFAVFSIASVLFCIALDALHNVSNDKMLIDIKV